MTFWQQPHQFEQPIRKWVINREPVAVFKNINILGQRIVIDLTSSKQNSKIYLSIIQRWVDSTQHG